MGCLLSATSNSFSHLTLMKRNFVVQRFHSKFSCSSSGHIHMCLFQLMNLPYESELHPRPALNVCVGLGHTFLETTQVSCLTANSLSAALHLRLYMSPWRWGHKFNISRKYGHDRSLQTCKIPSNSNRWWKTIILIAFIHHLWKSFHVFF